MVNGLMKGDEKMKKFLFAKKDDQKEVITSLLWIPVLLSIITVTYGQESTLVIENARVIVGNGVVKDVATVIITEDRIQSVSSKKIHNRKKV